MKKFIQITLITLLALFGGILLLKSILGDHLAIPRIKVSNYLNPALFVLLIIFMIVIISKDSIKKIKVDWLVVIFFVIIFLTIFQYDFYPLQVEGDGIGYFAYLRSMYFDKDIYFNNEFEALKAFRYGVCSYKLKFDCLRYTHVPETNMVPNSFSIGPSLLWMPFYHLTDICYRKINPNRTGYETIYLNVLRFATIFYGFLGVLFLYFALRSIFRPHVSLLAILAILFCSPMYAFLKTQPFYSHIHSFFAVSLFMFILVKIKDSQNPLHWMILGAAAGIATLMRWQNAMFVLVPVFFALMMLLKNEFIPRKEILSLYLNLPLFALCFFLFLIPQLVAFKLIFGTFYTIPQGNSFITFIPKWIIEVLFSANHGLFHWHPLLILGLIGFFLTFRGSARNSASRALFYSNSVGFGLQTYINASIPQYWAGASFGARRFIDSFVFLSFGMANFIEHMYRKKIWKSLFLAAFNFFFVFNVFMEKAYIKNVFHHERPFHLLKLAKVSLDCLTSDLKLNPKYILFLVAFLVLANLTIHLLRKNEVPDAGPGSLS